jgi:hypothetical protein
MAEITNLRVNCSSPRANGTAAEGEYDEDEGTIVAVIKWFIAGKNPTTGPHELQLLQAECTVDGEVGRKRLSGKKYKVASYKGNGRMTLKKT